MVKVSLRTKIVEGHHFIGYPKIIKHLGYGSIYYWGSVDVKFNVFRLLMLHQIIVVNHLVNKAHGTFPIVLRHWLRQSNGKGEVGKLFFDSTEMLLIENLLLRAGPVPEGYLTTAFQGMEKVEQVRAHGGHTGTTTNKHHFTVGILQEELPIRT